MRSLGCQWKLEPGYVVWLQIRCRRDRKLHGILCNEYKFIVLKLEYSYESHQEDSKMEITCSVW